MLVWTRLAAVIKWVIADFFVAGMNADDRFRAVRHVWERSLWW
jgi:hypothetical protein